MCLEDIYIGRNTVDTSFSESQILVGYTNVRDMVIPANQYRTGLLVWGRHFFIANSGSPPTNRFTGSIDVYRDVPPTVNDPFSTTVPFSTAIVSLTDGQPWKEFWIRDHGLLVQRKFTMRVPAITALGVADVFIFWGYTEYVFPDATSYLNKKFPAGIAP